MRKSSASVSLLLVVGCATAAWGTTKGVKGIGIIVKKHPTGDTAFARTDGNGTTRFFLAEAGEYQIEFGSREAVPRIVSATGEIRVSNKAVTKTGSTSGFAAAETIALGRMALDSNPTRVRLKHPRIDLPVAGVHLETITVFGPAELMLRLTEDLPDPARPEIRGLPRRLEFVSIEGGPAPASQPVEVTAATALDWQIQFAPVDRIAASFSKPGGRLAGGASDTVNVTVQAVGLAPGIYRGQMSILTASGQHTGEPSYVPLYLRVLPRTQILDPALSRRTLVFPGGAGTQSLEVTNPNAVPQTYLLEAADAAGGRAVGITPRQLILQPGQSGRMTMTLAAGSPGPFTLRLTPQGRPPVNVFVRGIPAGAAGCLATELVPVLASVDAQIGEDTTGSVEVWDDCGRRVRDAVVKVESEGGASFLGINDGVKDVKIGLGKAPPYKSNAIAYVRDPLAGEITGSTGELSLGGTALPAIPDADKPFEIVEVVDAQTGEPGTVAPGAQLIQGVITKSSSNIKNNFPVPVKEHEGQSASIGDRILDIIGTDENGGLIVAIPTDLGPQFTTSIQSTKSGIKVPPLELASAPAAPALFLRNNPDGTPGTQTAIYKVNGEAREDYAADGGAPPKVGDIIEVQAAGLGATDADGNVLGAVKLLIGGVEAKVLSARRAVWPPRFAIIAEMPELKSLAGGASATTVKIVVDEIESAEVAAPPVEKLLTTKVTLTVSCSINVCSYKIDGTDYSGPTTLEFEMGAEVSFEVSPTRFPLGTSQRFRADYVSWGGNTSSQFKAILTQDITTVIQYDVAAEVVVGPGVTVTPASPDGFYRLGTVLNLSGSCPQGQVLGAVQGSWWTPNNTNQGGRTVLAASLPWSIPVLSAANYSRFCATPGNFNLTVTTSPPGLSVRIGAAGSFAPGPITQQISSTQQTTLETQQYQVLNGTGYQFLQWHAPQGLFQTGLGGITSVITPFLPTGSTTATASFSYECYVLTIAAAGGTVITNQLGNAFGFPSNCYRPWTTVTLTATPNPGNAFNGWAGDASGTTSSTTVTMTGPKTVTANFGSAGNITLTVTTNPVGLGVRIGASGGFSPGPISQQIPANQSTTIGAVGTQVLNGTGYTFANWSTGGTLVSTSIQPSSSLTATANYNTTCHIVTVNTSGSGSVSLSPQPNLPGFPNNCYVPGSAVTLTANPATGNTFTSWSGDAAGTASPITIVVDAPKTVTAAFGQQQNVTITLTTSPVGLAVRFGASGAFTPGPISQQFPQSNTSMTIATETPQLLNGTGYSFAGWNTGGSTPVTTMGTASNFTAIASFTAACHTLTVNPATGGSVTLNPASGAPGFPANCYAPGTVVTLTAAPGPGNVFTGWSGDASGSASPTTVTINAPKVVNAAFAAPQNVALTVASSPAGIGVRIGSSGGFAPGPITQQVPTGQPQTVAAVDFVVLNGTGYRFNNWSNGATALTTTVSPTASLTITATYRAACHIVSTSATTGGTLDLFPAAGGLAGFPNNCFAPGVQVRLLANAASGFGLRDVAINNNGAASTVTTVNTPINVNGPVTASATFIPRPATVSTIFPPVLVSGTTYRDNVFFSNPTPTPGSNLRIVGVTFTTRGGTGTVTLQSALPIVFGNLPANGQSNTLPVLFDIPASVTAYDIFLTVEVQNSAGTTFTNVVSVGQTK